MIEYTEEIVEDRVWRHGVEIVSRINWTHVARLRRSLGVMEGGIRENPLALAERKARGSAVVRPLTLETAAPRRVSRVPHKERRSA